jgi:type I restriction enzyme, R subunit
MRARAGGAPDALAKEPGIRYSHPDGPGLAPSTGPSAPAPPGGVAVAALPGPRPGNRPNAIMTPPDPSYDSPWQPQPSVVREEDIEQAFLRKLADLKYACRPDIHDRAGLEANFRAKFENLNRVRLTDAEFARLLDEILTSDVFAASRTLRGINAFTREDGTPLNFTLVNIKDWCKNDFEVIHQLRINTDNSHHRYDVILLINGVPVVQVELKTLGVSPRRAMEQIVEYKNDPGNGYTKTLLCFIQLFIVSNRTRTYYFANNHPKHFAFNAE